MGHEGDIAAAHFIGGVTASWPQLDGHLRDPDLDPTSPGLPRRLPGVGTHWLTQLPPRFRERDTLRVQDQGRKLCL